MKDLRIVFMGTPEFAVPTLQSIVENGWNVVGVITTPDRKIGRGQKIGTSAVKQYAVSQNLKVLQPEKLKADDFQKELKALNADIQVVVAFRMLPESIWDMPRLGTFNLHASLLPNYRGAAPINWAIMNGEKETGCTTFFLKHEIDTGDILDNLVEPILPEDNVGTVYERLMHKGAQLVVDSLDKIESGDYALKAQSLTGKEKEAPKIFKEDCEIDWSLTTEEIHNKVRGLNPYPCAYTSLNGQVLKVYETEKRIGKQLESAMFSDGKTELLFKTADGAIAIKELQLQGKKRMVVADFLRGYKF